MNTFYNSHTNTIPTGEIAGTDWADMNGRAHFVQFYQDDETIINAVAGYFVHGLRFGEICIMVATHEHTQAIGDRMHEWDPSVGTALAENRLIILDAHETLGKFMVNGMPDPQLFEDVVGGLLEKVASSGRSLRAFGELVAILADEGNAAAAVELEVLWNKLAEEHHFRLFLRVSRPQLDGRGRRDECRRDLLVPLAYPRERGNSERRITDAKPVMLRENSPILGFSRLFALFYASRADCGRKMSEAGVNHVSPNFAHGPAKSIRKQ